MTPQTLEMIKKLVAFDTVSRNSNLQLIHFVKDYLGDLGVHSHLVSNAHGDKANLFATIGPNVEGGVVLSGHTDVVPVDGQPWDSDPFEVLQKNGRLYGRGTSDMKSFLAVALALAPTMATRSLKRPIHFAFSYDEEVGCAGAPHMISRLVSDIARPAGVIVGEPTNMQPIGAHKGVTVLRTTVMGHEAHSSQVQRGVSAVTTAARLVAFIDDMMQQNRAAADPQNPFVPPYTTLHVGMIKGGTAPNIISRECSFSWDIRVLPGDDWRRYVNRLHDYANSLLPALKQVSEDASIKTDLIADAPPLRDEGGAAQTLAQRLSRCRCCGVVPYGTEGGLFQQKGFSTVVCGPGSIDQAHQPNEYIEVAQVSACEGFLNQLIDLCERDALSFPNN